jgi:hypothetical protein
VKDLVTMLIIGMIVVAILLLWVEQMVGSI